MYREPYVIDSGLFTFKKQLNDTENQPDKILEEQRGYQVKTPDSELRASGL